MSLSKEYLSERISLKMPVLSCLQNQWRNICVPLLSLPVTCSELWMSRNYMRAGWLTMFWNATKSRCGSVCMTLRKNVCSLAWMMVLRRLPRKLGIAIGARRMAGTAGNPIVGSGRASGEVRALTESHVGTDAQTVRGIFPFWSAQAEKGSITFAGTGQ